MATLGAGVKWLGYLVFAVTGIWSFILELQITHVAGGFGSGRRMFGEERANDNL